MLWKLVEELWSNIEKSNSYKDFCKRENIQENIEERKKKMDLMIYCENRNYFKMMCGKNYSKYCLFLSQYVDKSYQKFKESNNCIKGTINNMNYSYYFSEDCNLYDIPKTFPEYDSKTVNVLQTNYSRYIIPNCENTVTSEISVQGYFEDVSDLQTVTHVSPNYESWKSILYVSITSLGFILSFLFLYKVNIFSFENENFILQY